MLAACGGDPPAGSESSTSGATTDEATDDTPTGATISGTGSPAACEAGAWSGHGEDGAEDMD